MNSEENLCPLNHQTCIPFQMDGLREALDHKGGNWNIGILIVVMRAKFHHVFCILFGFYAIVPSSSQRNMQMLLQDDANYSNNRPVLLHALVGLNRISISVMCPGQWHRRKYIFGQACEKAGRLFWKIQLLNAAMPLHQAVACSWQQCSHRPAYSDTCTLWWYQYGLT